MHYHLTKPPMDPPGDWIGRTIDLRNGKLVN